MCFFINKIHENLNTKLWEIICTFINKLQLELSMLMEPSCAYSEI